MVVRTPQALAELYETDETAWLDATAELVRRGMFADIDPGTLAEYLADMAKRDRREVLSRLVVLIAHLLKWEYQPDRRTSSWRTTIFDQQLELRQMLESGTLRNHAVAVLADAYAAACKRAAAETGLSRTAFPDASPWDLDAVLADRDDG